MLEELTVKNYALIDNAVLRFGSGFNVLTGETGAGKSILIGALSLILGGKGGVEEIRSGAEETEVTALLRIEETPELREWSDKYGIEPEDDTLIIRRIIRTSGRGLASVQSVPVTRTALTELGSQLLDLHGQHEHQSLFQIPTHRKLLDRFAGLEDGVKEFSFKFIECAEMGKRIEELKEKRKNAVQEADFLKRALMEIESAQLKDGEEEELVERQKILSRHEELTREMERVVNTNSGERNAIIQLLRSAVEGLAKAREIDPSLTGLHERLSSTYYEIEDIVEDVRQRLDNADFNSAEMETVDARLNTISNLEKKYHSSSIAGLLAFIDEARLKLEAIDGREEEIKLLDEKRKSLQEVLSKDAAEISRKRSAASDILSRKVEDTLKSLGMLNARFSVLLDGKRSENGRTIIGPYGMDNVEFQLSANKGESLKPLKSVASGGEISRVMLALKTVLAESDPVPIMIFDEIDSGIGGEVARSVGSHLHKLSKRKQVFCITHLASIAVFADNHISVTKTQTIGRTATRVNIVDGQFRVKEVSRMLAGDKEDAASLAHAARLLEERGWKY